MVGENSRDSVEKIALEAQCQGCTGLDDGLAGLWDIDILDGAPSDFATGAFTNGGHKPGPRSTLAKTSYGTEHNLEERRPPNCCNAILAVAENCDIGQ